MLTYEVCIRALLLVVPQALHRKGPKGYEKGQGRVLKNKTH